MPPLLSVVSPVYRGEKLVRELVRRIQEALDPLKIDYEIVLVEDGSADQSWARIKDACAASSRVKGIRLSRNFGQHAAITAGLEAARGSYVAVMDCDLQDNPQYLPKLLELAQAGNEIVLTRKVNRRHPWLKNILGRAFHRLFAWLTDSDRVVSGMNVGTFSILERKVVQAFLGIKDQHRHYLMIVRWLGFRIKYLEVVHDPRFEGKSSYSFIRLVQHGINGITSQSKKLLTLSIQLGFLFCACALLYFVYLIFHYFSAGVLLGWTSVVSLILLSTGVILIMMGVLGIYVGNIFDQVRARPIYVTDEKIGF